MTVTIQTTTGTYTFDITSIVLGAVMQNYADKGGPRPVEISPHRLDVASTVEPPPAAGSGVPGAEPAQVAQPADPTVPAAAPTPPRSSNCLECGKPAKLFLNDEQGQPIGGCCSHRCLSAAAARQVGAAPPIVVGAPPPGSGARAEGAMA